MDNVTTPKRAPIEVVEFDSGGPSILDLLIGLDGVGAALNAQACNLNLNDHDEVERMTDLGVAAAILAKQLRDRYSGRPTAKRRRPKLEAVA